MPHFPSSKPQGDNFSEQFQPVKRLRRVVVRAGVAVNRFALAALGAAAAEIRPQRGRLTLPAGLCLVARGRLAGRLFVIARRHFARAATASTSTFQAGEASAATTTSVEAAACPPAQRSRISRKVATSFASVR